MPRLVEESLDQAFRICRALAKDDDDVALVFAQLGERRLRIGLAALLDRRLVAPQALRRFLASGPRDLTAAVARAGVRPRGCAMLFAQRPGGLDAFLAAGRCAHPQFAMLAADIARARATAADDRPASTTAQGQAAFRVLVDRLRGYFMTQDGQPRDKALRGDRLQERPLRRPTTPGNGIARGRRRSRRRSPKRCAAFRRDLNVIQSRGVWRMFAVALRNTRAPRSARAARFLRRARARGQAAAGDGRVRAAAGSGSNPAITTCSSTSSRTPAARSGSWWRSWCAVGGRVGRVGRRASAVDLHRRRSEAVDLWLSRCRRRRAGRGGAFHRGAAAGRRSAAAPFRSASDRCRRCWHL